MWIEPAGRVEAAPEIVVELVGTGPPGEAPHIGENGNWWVGDQDIISPYVRERGFCFAGVRG